MKKNTLWTRDFSLIIFATSIGAAGGILSTLPLSFLVFDETGSTFAAALLIAIRVIPEFIIPLVAAPWLDRRPRKPFLVGGDAINGALYLLAGFYLLKFEFSYIAYMLFSLVLAGMGSFDMLAYDSLFPQLIPKGFEQKGYSVASMVYPTLVVIMTPIAALLYKMVGVGVILLIQGVLSLIAAAIESNIRVVEQDRRGEGRFSVKLWWGDIKEAATYLKNDQGMRGIYAYTSITNGISGGYGPLMIAFFSTTAGFSVAMYALFSVAAFAGRSLGGLFHYHVQIPKKKRFSFAYAVYVTYDLMDTILLWLPYPLMMLNRVICGFLGINSASLRRAAVQMYIPDELRAKLNAFESILVSIAAAIFSLLIGALGEVLSYRMTMTVAGLFALLCTWLTIWRNRKGIRNIYQPQDESETTIQA
ncbi:MAG: MFS transporter [Clostridiales bacterium]|nr:MFS transporter [Clostridiales bacterium]